MAGRLARFVALHDVGETETASVGSAYFAVVLARAPGGVVLVFNRYRQVWELPGGLIDAGETPRQSAARELLEEAGCVAGPLRWLGLCEVSDGRTRFGAVYRCAVDAAPAAMKNDEIDGIALWTPASALQPLGFTDRALLHRFGSALAE